MIEKSRMSRSSWKRHSKYSVRTEPVFEKRQLTPVIVGEMPNNSDAHSSWLEIEGSTRRFAYSKNGANQALLVAGFFEKVTVVRQLASYREYTACATVQDRFAYDNKQVRLGKATWEELVKKYPDIVFHEHREHEALVENFKAADEHREHLERLEEQGILKKFSNVRAVK
jgi:hypothetical protein